MPELSADQLRRITAVAGILIAVFGAAVALAGVFLIVSPHETLSTLTVIVGVLLLVDGILAIGSSLAGHGEGRTLLALVGVLGAIAGLVLIKKPFGALTVFALIVGVWFIVAGIVRVLAGLAGPDGRAGNLLIAALDLLAGIVVLSWPGLGIATLAVILGIVLVLRGALLIAAGIALRRIGRAGAALASAPL